MPTNGFIPEGKTVSTIADTFRENFNATLDPTLWTTSVGSGMTLVSTGGTCTITTGTTANSETYIQTVNSWMVPVRAVVGVTVSQKIANQDIRVELVSINSNNVVASWDIAGNDNTTTTNATVETRNGGPSLSRLTNQTVPGVTSNTQYEIEITPDETWFHAKTPDNNGGRANSYLRNTVSPDPAGLYRLRVRVTNGSTAPASSTTVTLTMALIMDYTELTAEITGGRSGAGNAIGVPVVFAATQNVSISGTNSPVIVPSAAGTATSVAKVANAAGTTSATLVKSTAGRVYGWQFTNTGAAVAYVRLYNKATAPTVGTDSPALVIPCWPGQPIFLIADMAIWGPSAGIGFAVTAGAADLDATAITNANEVIGNIFYA